MQNVSFCFFSNILTTIYKAKLIIKIDYIIRLNSLTFFDFGNIHSLPFSRASLCPHVQHSYRMAIVDGDKAPRLARRFSVEGYPSVFRLFQNQFLEFSPDAARTTRNLLKFATATSDQLDTLEESGILFSSTLQSLKPQPSTQDVLEHHFFRSIQDLQV